MSLRFLNQFRATNKLVFINKTLASSFHKSCSALYAAPLQLKMPSLSPTMTEGNIIKWLKKEGEQVAPGDVLMEIQTDKAVIAFETEEEGTLAKILIPDDTKSVQVGTLVGLISLPGDDWKSVTVPSSSAPTSTPSATASAVETQQSHESHDLPQKIGPAARNLIQTYQINPSKIKPTAYIYQNGLKPKPIEVEEVVTSSRAEPSKAQVSQKPAGSHPEYEPDYQDIELSNMRKVIAKRLVFSKTTIPHSYIAANVVVDKIIELRKEMIKNNQKVSINDFLTKAAALALRLVPEINSNLNEKTGEYTQLTTVDISTAVATENGLITPIIKNADKISVSQISENVKQLAEKARQNKLQPHEFQGGSFTISNLGMFGISEFSAVINPPQIAIMAVGKSQLKFNTNMKKQTEITLTLSYDERCCSLDRAQKFLNTLNYLLANPELLIDKDPEF
ncbi:unnamed protein product [Brachionus calyciflorus]|uniref:Dihydrolipoamide acetyltransferase component of pyruvate dehydrogenase complex n=1 Tax=Brachionus calyciflorus TaxID=104777 RepID=A0A813Q961_9BILA|nr:unnamed protein product [Brachionus calyciflorus]